MRHKHTVAPGWRQHLNSKRIIASTSLILFVTLSHPAAAVPTPLYETIRFGHFGTVTLYRSTPHPSRVALLISGDAGWDPTMVKMAEGLEAADALVVGIDIRGYVRAVDRTNAKCAYPSGDFEPLSHFVQRKLGFPEYIRPVLVGYQSGATLAYAALAQSPTGTFQGALSLGFSPTLSMSKPFCTGNGLISTTLPKGQGLDFQPSKNLEEPWIVLQGTEDRTYSPSETESYVGEVKGAEVFLVPGIAHRVSVEAGWLPRFVQAFKELAEHRSTERTAEAPEVRDLPLVEILAAQPASDVFAVLISGDGGWAGLDRSLAGQLAAKGVAVVGFNSLQYFWRRRTPAKAAQDLSRVLMHYLTAWNKKQIILIGYSFGADVLPFMADRLSPELKTKTRLIALLGPDAWAEFEFHLTDWIGSYQRKNSLPVLPEVAKLQGMKVLCVCGDEEKNSPCRKLDREIAYVTVLKGGHHFNGDYQALCRSILEEASGSVERSPSP